MDPPIPPEADLRGMQFMPLFGDRLFTSTTWIASSPEGRCAALRLWWHAYGHEVPASSLPDDDRLLAEYAGYGVAVKAWLKIKDQAMRGWFKCSDGRWYHKTVSEIAAEAWQRRLRDRAKKEKFRNKNRPGTVPETVPGPSRNGSGTADKTRQDNTPYPQRKYSRAHGTNPRALANALPDGIEALGPPKGWRIASFDDRDAWLRETGKPELAGDCGHFAYPKYVPEDWTPLKRGAG